MPPGKYVLCLSLCIDPNGEPAKYRYIPEVGRIYKFPNKPDRYGQRIGWEIRKNSKLYGVILAVIAAKELADAV